MYKFEFSRINYYSRINIYFVRDWSKSIGGRGVGQSREVVGHQFLNSVNEGTNSACQC